MWNTDTILRFILQPTRNLTVLCSLLLPKSCCRAFRPQDVRTDSLNPIQEFFDGYVHPWLEHPCALWYGGNYQKLVKLQDKFYQRHQIRLPPLKARFEYHTAVLFFKIRSDLSPIYVANFLPASIRLSSRYNLRKCVFPTASVNKSSSLSSLYLGQLFFGTASQRTVRTLLPQE